MLRCLYIHTPYCVHKCGYCDFNSYARDRHEEKFRVDAKRYVQCLLKEWDLWQDWLSKQEPSDHFQFHEHETSPTVFVGGGTPSLLPVDVLDQLFSRISEGPWKWREVTMEANPESMDEEKRSWLLDSCVTRLSFGIQSFDPLVLTQLERLHSQEQTLDLLNWLQNQSKLRWSGDFIYGVPDQSPQNFLEHLKLYSSFRGANHVSCYQLTLKPGHPLFDRMPTSDEEAIWWDMVLESMNHLGFEQYEVSNFMRSETSRCEHNLNYWRGRYFLGLGAGAASYLPGGSWGVLSKNLVDPRRYMETIESGKLAAVFESPLTESQALEQTLMMRFRTTELISISDLQRFFPSMDWPAFERSLSRWESAAIGLERGSAGFRLSPQALRLSDELLLESLKALVPDERSKPSLGL